MIFFVCLGQSSTFARNFSSSFMNLRTLFKKFGSHSGLWFLIVAAVALESIACIQYFYSRAAIKDEAVYRARAELRAAELEINAATAEMEAAAKVLAKMVEHDLHDPQASFIYTHALLETLDNVEAAGVAFVADYYPSCGKWYEVYSSRNEQVDREGIYTRQIGGPDHDYLQAEWFQNGLRIDSTWWSEPYYDNAGAKTIVVSCSYPVRDKSGEVVGAVCIDMSLSHLQRVSQYLQVYQESYFSIQSSTGIDLVARPDTVTGRKYMIFNEEIEKTGWRLSVIIPEDILFADLNRVGLWITILMLLSLGLLVFIMYRSAVNVLRLIDVYGKNQRMENELEVAQTIQMAMLPKVFPPFSDRLDLNVYGSVLPAKEVGGDLYDFFVRDEKMYFCIGDVSGKGVPAALIMATTRSLFRSVCAHEDESVAIITEINNTLSEANEQNMFITLFVGILDLSTGLLDYCNAGHNAPVLLTGSGSQLTFLPVLPNLPVGVMNGFTYESQQVTLAHNDLLFLYTDGLTEAENMNHAQFGEDRMMQTLQQLCDRLPRFIVDGMQHEVDAFVGEAEQSDDLTMLAFRYQQPALVMRNDIQQIPTLSEWVDWLHVPDELNMPINLALEEIVANVMLYAYPENKSGQLIVESWRCKGNIYFAISDMGKAFDPTAHAEADITLSAEERPIGGLGIHLVRQLMDEVNYARLDGKNILMLRKKLD